MEPSGSVSAQFSEGKERLLGLTKSVKFLDKLCYLRFFVINKT